MAYDAHKNFAYSTVATAPSPAASGTSLVVATGDGAKFPTPPFNCTVWPANLQPLTSNAEIVRVTDITGDTLTIVRTQESTSARTIIVGDQIANTITAKVLTDVETAAPNAHDIVSLHTYSGGAALDVFGLSAANTIARLTPSSAPGAASAILKSDASGYLQLVRLGIGVTPSYPLHISQTLDGSVSAPVVLNPSTSTSATVGSVWGEDIATNKYLSLGVYGTNYTTASLALSAGFIAQSGLTNGLSFKTAANAPITFATNNATKVYITGGERVSLNVGASPLYTLDVLRTTNDAGYDVMRVKNANSGYTSSVIAVNDAGSTFVFGVFGSAMSYSGVGGGEGWIGAVSNVNLNFIVNNLPVARFTTSGALLIGTQTAASAGSLLRVAGHITPNADYTGTPYDLGTASLSWNNVYTNKINSLGISSDVSAGTSAILASNAGALTLRTLSVTNNTGAIVTMQAASAASTYLVAKTNGGSIRGSFGWRHDTDEGGIGNDAQWIMNWGAGSNPTVKFRSTGLHTFSGSVGIGDDPVTNLYVKGASVALDKVIVRDTLADGYSSIGFQDYNGASACGFGYANPSGWAPLANKLYFYSVSKSIKFSIDGGTTAHLYINAADGGTSVASVNQNASGAKLRVAGHATCDVDAASDLGRSDLRWGTIYLGGTGGSCKNWNGTTITTSQTIIADGTNDVTSNVTILYSVNPSAGTPSGGMVNIQLSGSTAQDSVIWSNDAGTEYLTVTVATNGSVTVARTGTLTYTANMWLVWI